jgi:predicted HAD superfamily Cof-like phosphohydrolase
MSKALAVKEFSEGAKGKQPDRPTSPLSRSRVEFIVSMVCSEMVELLQTVTTSEEDPVRIIKNLCGKDYNRSYVKPPDNDVVGLIAEQADAMVDAAYYMYDTATGMGVNLDGVFNIVQAANMAKRDVNGKFIIRASDGKIIKPEGWKEPDIRGEISRQMRDGAWN